MTHEQKNEGGKMTAIDKLAELYGAVECTAGHLMALSARNVSGLAPHERVELDLAYRRATVEHELARRAYDRAITLASAMDGSHD